MEDPEFTDFWQLLGYRDAITPEIQRAALAAEVFWPCEIYYHAPADVRDGLIHALLSAEYSSAASNLMSCLAMQGDDKAMETLLELERNPRPWRKGLYVDPSSYAQIGGWTFDKEGQKSSSTSTPAIPWSREPLARNLPSALAGHGRTPAPLRRADGGHAGAGRPGRAAPVPGAGWYPDRHLLPQLRGIPERPRLQPLFSGWRRGDLSLRAL